MTREDIVARIQRLLALSDKSRNNSEAEASLAASMAAKLMAEHNVEQLELVDEGVVDAEPLENCDLYSMATRRRTCTWRSVLANAVARVNSCRVVNATGGDGYKKLLILGRQSNVRAVTYLYRYLEREVEAISQLKSKGRGRGYGNAFKHGMVERLSERLAEEWADRELAMRSATTALVKRDRAAVDDYVAGLFPRLRHARRAQISSASGYTDGVRAGNDVQLGRNNKGLKAPAPELRS